MVSQPYSGRNLAIVRYILEADLEIPATEARSFLEPLSEVVRSGVNVLVWAGDLDWICNWYGSQLVVNSINYTDSATFQSAKLAEYTVNGKSHGQFKTAGNLNFLRVYEAGHEVPYYRKSAFNSRRHEALKTPKDEGG